MLCKEDNRPEYNSTSDYIAPLEKSEDIWKCAKCGRYNSGYACECGILKGDSALLEKQQAERNRQKSERAVQFRKWVNQIAKDYTIKGWVMDDERLKRGTYLTEKYFDEQLERIREIRASERKFYQKITDLYATAIDYDKNSATTRRFYATVQNKMHYAVHGHTAAKLIAERADHTREHMGLTTWADAPEGKIKKSDVTIAKNYLSQDEMKQLNRMVTA